ncbi:DUF397 domain-containing protein [Nocardia asteroides]
MTVSGDLACGTWYKSSHSGGHGDCVEVAFLRGSGVGGRDSRDSTGSALVFTASAWNAFTTGVAVGALDRTQRP